MILTVHLLTGAAIASKISNPLWALPLATLSHYLLDLLPQQEYSIKNIQERRWRQSFFDWLKVFLDLASGAALILLFSRNSPLIFAAAFLAIVPDGFTLLAILFPKNKLLSQHWLFHRRINNIDENRKISSLWRIFFQVLVVLIAIFLL